MHELLLLTPHPLLPTRHPQLLSILTGLSGMQPVPILESHLLFLPNKRPRDPADLLEKKVGGSQDVRVEKRRKEEEGVGLWALKCVGERVAIDKGKEVRNGDVNGGQDIQMEGDEDGGAVDHGMKDGRVRWTLQHRDLPEVVRGERQVTSRGVSDTVIETDDPIAFMEGMEYRYGSNPFSIPLSTLQPAFPAHKAKDKSLRPKRSSPSHLSPLASQLTIRSIHAASTPPTTSKATASPTKTPPSSSTGS